MAGNMAWKVGKGAIQKFSGNTSHQDPTIRSVDHSHYWGAKVERKSGHLVLNDGKVAKYRKDSAYYEYRGIPKKDAKTLSHVVSCARFLDNGIGAPFIPFRIGVNTIVGIIPEAGDFIGSGLSCVLVWLPARRVCKGDDPDARALKKVLNKNLVKGFAIGLVPIAGDVFDSWIKFNVKSADALEAMLLKRAAEAAKLGLDAEEVERTNGHQHASTNGHHRAATNRYHDSEPSSHPPRRFVGNSDLRQDSQLAATGRAPVALTQSKKSGGTFFQRRRGPQSGQDFETTVEDVAPGRRSRPEHSNYESGGHF